MTHVYRTSRYLAASLGIILTLTAAGAAMELYDTFDGATLEVIDGVEHITTDAGAVWARSNEELFEPYEIEALPGAMRLYSGLAMWSTSLGLQSIDGVPFEPSMEWSMRSRISATINRERGGNLGLGTSALEVAAIVGDNLAVGVNWNISQSALPGPLEGEEFYIQLDVADDGLTGHIWPADDPSAIVTTSNRRFTSDSTRPDLFAFRADTTFLDVLISDSPIPLPEDEPPSGGLMAGDADQDLDFDQFDLVKVQMAAKYLAGQAATWGEGDWDGAPGGSVGSPPEGDGLFNQLDIISALAPAHYLTGPYAAVRSGGQENDGQTSVVYDPGSGEIAVDAPAGTELTSINIDSAAGIFTGGAAANLGGSFDNDADNNIFKATFGSSFGSLSFGSVAQAGLSEAFLLDDLTVVGSLAGGGSLGDVDLVYVPEPATLLLLALGAFTVSVSRWRQRRAVA